MRQICTTKLTAYIHPSNELQQTIAAITTKQIYIYKKTHIAHSIQKLHLHSEYYKDFVWPNLFKKKKTKNNQQL